MNQLDLLEAMGEIKQEHRLRAFEKPQIVHRKTHRFVAAACFLLIAGAAFGLAHGIKAPEKAGTEQSIAAEITEIAAENITAENTQTTAAAQIIASEAEDASEKTVPAHTGRVSGGDAGAAAGPGTVAAQPVSPSEPENVPEILTEAAAEPAPAQTETTAAEAGPAQTQAAQTQTEPAQTEPAQTQTEPSQTEPVICTLAADASVHASYAGLDGTSVFTDKDAKYCYDWIRDLGTPEVYVRPIESKFFEMIPEQNSRPAVMLTFDEPQSMTVYDLEAEEYRTRDNIKGFYVRKVGGLYYIIFIEDRTYFNDGFTVIELTVVPNGWPIW